MLNVLKFLRKKGSVSIQRTFFRNTLFIVLVSTGLLSLIWIQDEYSAFKVESSALRAAHLQEQKTLLNIEVKNIVTHIDSIRMLSSLKLERQLRERVYAAHQIALSLYRENVETKEPSEIKKMIKDALRQVRFDDGRGYYFAVSLDGVEQLYPVRPELEGKNILDLQDEQGHFVIQDEIEIIRLNGEGFIESVWAHPEKDSSLLYSKKSYIKHFKPFDWYLGIGEYVVDFEAQIQQEVLGHLVNLRFLREGYFFGSTFTGEPLFSGGTITKGGGNLWNLTDPSGVKIIQEQRKAVETPEGGYVSYNWPKLNAEKSSPKLSFVLGIPEWEWVIGAGLYLDTIETTIAANRSALAASLQKRILRSALVLVALLCLSLFWTRRIAMHMQKTIETFLLFLKQASNDFTTVDTEDIQLQEFKEIAKSTNKMLKKMSMAKNALEESEEKYRSIFENAVEGFFQSTPGGRFIDVNPAFVKMFGYASSEELITTVADINKQYYVNPDDRKRYIEILEKTGRVSQFEHQARKKDGTRVWLSDSTRTIYDDHGAIVRYEGNVIDITERKQTEDLLRKAQEIGRIGAWELDIVENKLLWTDETYRIFELSPDLPLTIETFFNGVYPADREYVEAAWNVSLETKSYDIEHRLLVGGKLKWVRKKAEFECDENGECIRAIGLVHDITDFKSAIETKIDIEGKMSAILNSSPMMIWCFDGQIYSYISAEWYRFSGQDPSLPLTIERWTALLHPDDLEKSRRVWEENWQEKTAHINIFRLRRFDGVYRQIQAYTIPVFDEKNEFRYFQGYNLDVTELFESEAERLKLVVQLEQRHKMEAIGTLAGGIAHDFNNILTAILGYSQMAREQLSADHPIRTDLDQVIQSGHRAADLVQQILTFSRQKEADFKPLNIQLIIGEVLKLLRASLPTTITIEENIPAVCKPIMANPTQIHQILMNLCANAKYSIGNIIGTLKVALSEFEVTSINTIVDCPQMADGTYLCLEVTDTGQGMDEQVRLRIFEPFFTTKGLDEGTGLGLSVVHGIVKQHKGEITVVSQPGQGTTFCVYLPVLQEVMHKDQDIIVDIAKGTERVLLVDDELLVAEMMQRMLERLGYTVTTVTSSVEALGRYTKNPDLFDLVITDMTMPQMDGATLSQKLLTLQPELPIILCTGFSEAIDESTAKALGIREYIKKPIVRHVLAKAIRKALDHG